MKKRLLIGVVLAVLVTCLATPLLAFEGGNFVLGLGDAIIMECPGGRVTFERKFRDLAVIHCEPQQLKASQQTPSE